MNKIVLLLITISSFAYAQVKPTYQIDVHKEGQSIGIIELEMFPYFAPNHIENFDSLVNIQFFDSLAFHRVIEGFMMQGGDPNTLNLPDSTWGMGQPDQVTVDAEFNLIPYVRGILGAARDEDPNSASSQFFICHDDATFLTNNYTAYGRAINGMNVVDSVCTAPTEAEDRPVIKTIMFITKGSDLPSIIEPTELITEDSLSNVNYFKNFEWEHNPNSLFHEIQLSQSVDFSVIEQSKTADDEDMVFTNLETGGIRYYWRVISYDGAIAVTSETRTFLTKFLASVSEIENNPIIYFNENQHSIIIKSSSTTAKNIEIHSIQGKLINSINTDELESQLSIGTLSSQVVIVTFRSEDVYTEKKVFIH